MTKFRAREKGEFVWLRVPKVHVLGIRCALKRPLPPATTSNATQEIADAADKALANPEKEVSK